MLLLALVAVLLVFAVQAIRARGLITSALWLAGVSAVTSVLLYMLGARLVAVVELSVGAGLVTVLFVFAINIAGDDAIDRKTVPPVALISPLAALFVILLGWFVWPGSICQAILHGRAGPRSTWRIPPAWPSSTASRRMSISACTSRSQLGRRRSRACFFSLWLQSCWSLPSKRSVPGG